VQLLLMAIRFVLSLLVVAAVCAEPFQLTEENFDASIANKGAFVKFFAPWCGHCKSMKPAWDQLADEMGQTKNVVIGDVDCTVQKALCERFGVKGYPTIKSFTAGNPDGEDYKGGRDLSALKNHAQQNLGPSCSLDNKDLCSAEQLAELEEASKLGLEALEEHIATEVAKQTAAETHFQSEVSKLQAQYQELVKHKDAEVNALAPKLRIYRSVVASLKKPETREL